MAVGAIESNRAVVQGRRRRQHVRAWRRAGERLLWCEPFWIAVLAPALLFPGRFWVTELQPLWVLLLFTFWPLRLLLRGRALRRTPLDLPLIAMIVATGAALAVSPAPASSWEAAGYLLLGVAAAAALIQWPPVQAQPSRLAWLLLGLCAAIALAGVQLLGAHADKLRLGILLSGAGSWAGVLGETVNPNVLGGALIAPCLLALALAAGPRWSRVTWQLVWFVCAAIFAAILALTQCRGAYLGLAVGALVLLWLRWSAGRWLLIVLAALGAAFLLLHGGLGLAFDAIGGGPTQPGIAGTGLAQRMAIWQAALAAVQQQPFTGIGLGLFGPWVQQHGLIAGSPAGALNGPPHAHNLLLQVTADLGLLGLGVYLALWATVIAMIVALLRARPLYAQAHDRREGTQAAPTQPHQPQRLPVRIAVDVVHRQRLHWTLAAGCAAALTGMFVHGLVDAAQWGNKVAFLPWLIFALAAVLYLDSKESA